MTDFFIADTHFGHRRIIEFCPDSRPFNSIEEHDNTLIENWNEVVSENDRVFVLGDFFLGGYKREDRIKEILNQLKGNKVLVQGNHDLDKSATQWLRLGFDRVAPMVTYKGCILTHIPLDKGEIKGQSSRGRWLANIHGHLHDHGNTKEMNETGRFCVSAEQTFLTPVSWNYLWDYICKRGGRYLPLNKATKVITTLENKTNLGLYNVDGKRIKGETVSIDPKIEYYLFSTSIDNDCIMINPDARLLNSFIVKSKNFVGIEE